VLRRLPRREEETTGVYGKADQPMAQAAKRARKVEARRTEIAAKRRARGRGRGRGRGQLCVPDEDKEMGGAHKPSPHAPAPPFSSSSGSDEDCATRTTVQTSGSSPSLDD